MKQGTGAAVGAVGVAAAAVGVYFGYQVGVFLTRREFEDVEKAKKALLSAKAKEEERRWLKVKLAVGGAFVVALVYGSSRVAKAFSGHSDVNVALTARPAA